MYRTRMCIHTANARAHRTCRKAPEQILERFEDARNKQDFEASGLTRDSSVEIYVILQIRLRLGHVKASSISPLFFLIENSENE